jgi:hypothetical protein
MIDDYARRPSNARAPQDPARSPTICQPLKVSLKFRANSGVGGFITMDDHDDIARTVYASMKQLNLQLPEDDRLIESLETILVGEGGVLDSLGLITLLVNTEQALLEEHNLRVTLLDELMTVHSGRHPFERVNGLVDWIVQAQNAAQSPS